jgi:hypothetical protein
MSCADFPPAPVRRAWCSSRFLDWVVHRMTMAAPGELLSDVGRVTLWRVGGVLTAWRGGQQRWRSLRAAIGGWAWWGPGSPC